MAGSPYGGDGGVAGTVSVLVGVGKLVEEDEEEERVTFTSGIIHDDDDDGAAPDKGTAVPGPGGANASVPKQSVHSNSCICACSRRRL